MFGEERGRDVRGRVAPPASGGDEAGGGQVLAGGEDRHQLVLPALPPAAEGQGEYEHDGGDDGQHHGDHHHVEALAVEGDHLCLDLAGWTDEDLVVGGQLGLVQLPRPPPRPGDGGHRQVVGGEVAQVGQLRLDKRRSGGTSGLTKLSHQIQVRGVTAAHVNLPLGERLVLPRLVVDDEGVDLAVDEPGPPPLHQDVPGPGAVDVGDPRRAGLGGVRHHPPSLRQSALSLGCEGQH